ncbi:hypothetical protein [Paludisphaera rhizosphaerae]|uniref:hypothetical protein n=1 Tax=Paludisphaera rhizosphaerae TaxID=2711216 RepID=UPI0013ED4ADB|nr:hypothetical protein [Paludisphaera rhizosphaerae]
MSVAPISTSEAAIFGRILQPEEATLNAAAARAILALDFDQADKDRMRDLLTKAKKGALTTKEAAEAENYERVGHVLSLMKSKARLSLKREE